MLGTKAPTNNKEMPQRGMTQQKGAKRRTSGHYVQKWRVWGATPTSRFFTFGRKAKCKKYASVATLALLAVLCKPQNRSFSWAFP